MRQLATEKKNVEMMILEGMIDTEKKARISQAKPQTTTGKDGRPRKAQFEGKVPGAGLGSAIKDFAQNMGATSLGLEGLGSNPGQDD